MCSVTGVEGVDSYRNSSECAISGTIVGVATSRFKDFCHFLIGIGVQKALKKAKLVERRPEKLKLASPREDLKDQKLAILLAGFWASPLGLLTTFHSNR